MVQLFPRVAKTTLLDGEHVFNLTLNAFFNSKKVNVFTAFTSREVKISSESENADIIYTFDGDLKPQSYKIIIGEKINISYGDDAGAYYASVTLNQLLSEKSVEYCELYDEPQLKVRGFMYDISRDKVSKLSTLKKIVDLLALLKYNHFELYVEGFSFEYKSFEHYLEEDGFITLEEYKELEKYCNDRFIDLVPNQNGFGHMTDWLEKEEFADLRICPNGSYIWGRNRKASTLNPLKEGSIELIKKMYADMLPYSNSKYFNMNFDEPFELGLELTEEECEKVGKGNLYIDYALKAYDVIKSYNKTPLIWGDVLINNSDLLYRLPKDMIFVDWGYDATYKFGRHGKLLRKKDIQFMTAPGTTSWCSWSTRGKDWLENITNAINATKAEGGLGVLLTDWGDFGHLQFLPVSYAPIVYCGLYSWTCREASYLKVADFLNKFVFKDKNEIIGDWFIDFGNCYQLEKQYFGNQTATFRTFMWAAAAVVDVKSGDPKEIIDFYKQKMIYTCLPTVKHKAFKKYFKYAKELLELSDMQADDKDLVISECIQSIDVMSMIQDLSICFNDDVDVKEKLAILQEVKNNKENIVETQKRLWLARNKSGGLNNSVNYIYRFYRFVDIVFEELSKEGEKV